jgi:hypothetical protein
MEISELINLVVQNGFMTVFACTILYFGIRVGNAYLEKLACKGECITLPDDLVVKLVRAEVWYHSRGKLRHIESILIENNIETRKDEITRKVRNALEERTLVYLEYFNTVKCKVEKLGDFYGKTFEMEPFFKEVMEVVLRAYVSIEHEHEISTKLKDIAEIMVVYQERTNTKLEEELNRLSLNYKKHE